MSMDEMGEMVDWLEMHYKYADGQPFGIAVSIADKLRELEAKVAAADRLAQYIEFNFCSRMATEVVANYRNAGKEKV